jgi:hypothetical protein
VPAEAAECALTAGQNNYLEIAGLSVQSIEHAFNPIVICED